MSNELKISEHILAEIKSNIAQSIRQSHEVDYNMIYEGFTMIGLNDQSDVDIVEQYIQMCVKRTPLLDQALVELNADAMLKGIEMYQFDLSDLEPVGASDDVQLRALRVLLNSLSDSEDITDVQAAIAKRKEELAQMKEQT